MRRSIPTAELAHGVVTGNRLALARAISVVENHAERTQPLLEALYPHTGHAQWIGITGAPGTGKSTLVTALAKHYRSLGQTVAVLAVDPSSPFTGGALLGDRVRMTALSGDAGVFIRSMASRGHLGGLAAASAEVLLVLDAAGFDRIIIETVGVGQAEVEIAGTAHSTVVVEAPGLGDEVQAIKAGVLEIGDIFVVNKADRSGAARTVGALEMMLEQKQGTARPVQHHGQWMPVEISAQASTGWTIPVLQSVATSETGIEEICRTLNAHWEWLHESGMRTVREEMRTIHLVEKLLQAEVTRRLQVALSDTRMSELLTSVQSRELLPHQAAKLMLEAIQER